MVEMLKSRSSSSRESAVDKLIQLATGGSRKKEGDQTMLGLAELPEEQETVATEENEGAEAPVEAGAESAPVEGDASEATSELPETEKPAAGPILVEDEVAESEATEVAAEPVVKDTPAAEVVPADEKQAEAPAQETRAAAEDAVPEPMDEAVATPREVPAGEEPASETVVEAPAEETEAVEAVAEPAVEAVEEAPAAEVVPADEEQAEAAAQEARAVEEDATTGETASGELEEPKEETMRAAEEATMPAATAEPGSESETTIASEGEVDQSRELSQQNKQKETLESAAIQKSSLESVQRPGHEPGIDESWMERSTEGKINELAKDPMWKTLMQFKSLLPVVKRVLPLLDLATQPREQHISAEVKESLEGLELSNRDVRATLQDQTLELKRVEEEVVRLREATDKAAFDQASMSDDLKAMRRMMKNAFLYLGFLLGLLVVAVGYMGFLVFNYLNHLH